MIDSHIHLDQFDDKSISSILSNPAIQTVIAVATDLSSAQRLVTLKKRFPQLQIAGGFHPEQSLPSQNEIDILLRWLAKKRAFLTACGEVGLPYYLKQQQSSLNYAPYIALLERFIHFSKRFDLPIILHIVYEDTEIALQLLAQYQIKKAHFHWFKASEALLEKVLATPYLVSVTPDILTNPKTQRVVEYFPLERLMIETDAPWQHYDFAPTDITGQLNAVVSQISQLKRLKKEQIVEQIVKNTKNFYLL